MKKVYKFLIVLLLAMFLHQVSKAQNARDILQQAYALHEDANELSVLYEIQYISDLDTGTTTVEEINFSYLNGRTRIDNPALISIGDTTFQLVIDHGNKIVTYIPNWYGKANVQVMSQNPIATYLPKEEDKLKMYDGAGVYTILIEPDGAITSIEYVISKKNGNVESLRLQGRVHPYFPEDSNAELFIKLKSIKVGKEAKLNADYFSPEQFVKNTSGEYTLTQFKDYELQVLQQ